MKWVVDASVAVRWLLTDEAHPNADIVLEALIDHPEHFAVPELFAFEVYAVLCRIHPEGASAFVKAIIPILNCGILRHPMTQDLARSAKPFVEKGLTGYDACYAALAGQLGARWLTFDEKAHQCLGKRGLSHLLSRSVPGNLRTHS